MLSYPRLFLALIPLLLTTPPAWADGPIFTFPDFDPEPSAEHVVHVDLTTSGVLSSLSLNYEYFFIPNLGLRLGYSASFGWPFQSSLQGTGGLLGLVYLSGGAHNFELFAGIDLSAVGTEAYDWGLTLNDKLALTPQAFLGYRAQLPGSIMARVGVGLTGAYGAGLVAGVGYAF